MSFVLGACSLLQGPKLVSISVDKKVMVDGGATWVEEVEQCISQDVKFKIDISNDGNQLLTDIVVSDLIPTGLEYV